MSMDNPRTHAEREAAQRADEADLPRPCFRCCVYGTYSHTPDQCPDPDGFTRTSTRADEAELQASLLATLPLMAGGSAAPRCPDCGDSGAARDCEPCVLATLPPMAGGSGVRFQARVTNRQPFAAGPIPRPFVYGPVREDEREAMADLRALTGDNLSTGHVRELYGPSAITEAQSLAELSARGRPPMAGGAPSHYDDPAWYADEAWALQEERNAESAQEAAEDEPLLATLPNGQEICGTVQPDGKVHVTSWPKPQTRDGRPFMANIMATLRAAMEHTHPCPTCHHDRSCTCTTFVPGEPLECATCSNCRGW